MPEIETHAFPSFWRRTQRAAVKLGQTSPSVRFESMAALTALWVTQRVQYAQGDTEGQDISRVDYGLRKTRQIRRDWARRSYSSGNDTAPHPRKTTQHTSPMYQRRHHHDPDPAERLPSTPSIVAVLRARSSISNCRMKSSNRPAARSSSRQKAGISARLLGPVLRSRGTLVHSSTSLLASNT